MGKPDWRKPEDYDRLDGLTPSLWAWEFLRRNREYILAWERYVDALCVQQKNPGPPYAYELCGASEWGIENGYHDPDDNNPDIKWLPLAGGTEAFIVVPKGGPSGTRIFGGADYDKGEVMLQFNFRQPITHQLKNAEKTLRRLREEVEKMGIKLKKGYKSGGWKVEIWYEEWKMLLRVFDATAAGVKDKEIASELYPPRKAEAEDCEEWEKEAEAMRAKAEWKEDIEASIKWVYDKRKQAMRLIKRNYRLILYSEQ